jgi:hypothetical protein
VTTYSVTVGGELCNWWWTEQKRTGDSRPVGTRTLATGYTALCAPSSTTRHTLDHCFGFNFLCHTQDPQDGRSRDSVVGVATGYGLDDRRLGVRVPVGSRFSLLHVVQTDSGAHRTFYPMGTEGLFPRGQSGRGVKLTTRLQLVPRSSKCGSIHPLPHTPSWRSA